MKIKQIFFKTFLKTPVTLLAIEKGFVCTRISREREIILNIVKNTRYKLERNAVELFINVRRIDRSRMLLTFANVTLIAIRQSIGSRSPVPDKDGRSSFILIQRISKESIFPFSHFFPFSLLPRMNESVRNKIQMLGFGFRSRCRAAAFSITFITATTPKWPNSSD